MFNHLLFFLQDQDDFLIQPNPGQDPCETEDPQSAINAENSKDVLEQTGSTDPEKSTNINDAVIIDTAWYFLCICIKYVLRANEQNKCFLKDWIHARVGLLMSAQNALLLSTIEYKTTPK